MAGGECKRLRFCRVVGAGLGGTVAGCDIDGDRVGAGRRQDDGELRGFALLYRRVADGQLRGRVRSRVAAAVVGGDGSRSVVVAERGAAGVAERDGEVLVRLRFLVVDGVDREGSRGLTGADCQPLRLSRVVLAFHGGAVAGGCGDAHGMIRGSLQPDRELRRAPFPDRHVVDGQPRVVVVLDGSRRGAAVERRHARTAQLYRERFVALVVRILDGTYRYRLAQGVLRGEGQRVRCGDVVRARPRHAVPRLVGDRHGFGGRRAQGHLERSRAAFRHRRVLNAQRWLRARIVVIDRAGPGAGADGGLLRIAQHDAEGLLILSGAVLARADPDGLAVVPRPESQRAVDRRIVGLHDGGAVHGRVPDGRGHGALAAERHLELRRVALVNRRVSNG